MIERLKQLMEYYSLSSSQLADSIGVPRSGISHLLTGRNKPSLDFILKLINKYPDVNLYWFLNGKGSFPPTNEIKMHTMEQPEPVKVIESHPEPKQLPIEDFPANPKAEEISYDKVERIVFFFKDGTFKTFLPK